MSWSDWVRGAEIEPSIYAADFSRLGAELGRLLDVGVRIFQFDVGDGHFVPAITMGPVVLESISPLCRERGAILDVHLMIEEPERQLEAFAGAGADSVTVHVEAVDDPGRAIALARGLGLAAGIAFSPETPVEAAARASRGADVVLCMGVPPGYSGQRFIPETLERVRRLRELLPGDVHVQVDGGVGPENVRELRDAGADLFVAGSAVFAEADPPEAYRRLAAAVR
ncbi:MAG: ribulose-phosphate 3-epimerase [Actinomycetota bacterium]|nr:ribulose-phosphate 3-epimerase [Actinomycetota bacterium]